MNPIIPIHSDKLEIESQNNNNNNNNNDNNNGIIRRDTKLLNSGIYPRSSIIRLDSATKGIQELKKVDKDHQNTNIKQLENLSKKGSVWNLIKIGNLKEIKKLKNNNNINENELGPFGETILHVSMLFKHNEISKYLIKSFPNLINKYYCGPVYYGETALHMAIANRNYI